MAAICRVNLAPGWAADPPWAEQVTYLGQVMGLSWQDGF